MPPTSSWLTKTFEIDSTPSCAAGIVRHWGRRGNSKGGGLCREASLGAGLKSGAPNRENGDKSRAPLLPTRRANTPAIPLSLMSCRPLLSCRFLLTAAPRRLFSTALPFPTVQSCPDPTCKCPPTPDLDIDHKKSLSGLVGPYKQHLVVATGQQDWTSRIEHDQSCGSLAAGVKQASRKDVRDPHLEVIQCLN